MSRTISRRTRLLSGRAKSRYVRALLERHGVAPNTAADADDEIMQVMVRNATAERLSTRPAARHRNSSANSNDPPSEALPLGLQSEEAVGPSLAATAIPPFNPYAFSAMAVLLNEGRAALEARLALATTREHIVQLAEAQSVRLDPAALAAKKTSLKSLRGAFIEAVEKRVAHRRAVSG